MEDDLFIANHLTPDEVVDLRQMFANLKAEFGSMIDENTWMDSRTKWHAHKKLDAVKANIGEMTFKDNKVEELVAAIDENSYIENVIEIGNQFSKNLLKNMNKQKDIWTEENIVNAFYAPHLNEFQINNLKLDTFKFICNVIECDVS